MKEQFTEFKKDFFGYVEKSKHIVVTAHVSPDDDSIGSVLSVHTLLASKYPTKDVRILYTGARVDRWKVLANFEKIQFVDDIAEYLENVDLLIVLDVSNASRVTKFPERIKTVQTIICIDHHKSPPDHFTLSLIDPTFSSNSELIYSSLIDGEILTKELAEPLLLGILGDTGNLTHIDPAQTAVYIIVKELVEIIGKRVDSFLSTYGGIEKSIFPIMQLLMANTQFVSMDGWPDFQYTYLDRAVMEAGNFSDEDMSAASHIYLGNYLPRMLGYSWGFVLTPRNDGTCRMSGRSLAGSVNVRDMHERLGVGGGHDRASGGYFKKDDPKECIAEVLEWMKNNKPVLG